MQAGIRTERNTLHRACVISPGRVAYGDGTSVDTHPSLASDLLTILTGTTDRFEVQGTVLIRDVPLSAFTGQSAGLKAAGWEHSTIAAWTLFHRGDGRTVAVGVQDALRGNQVGALVDDGTDAGVVALLLDRYHAATGTAWRGTYVTTALAAMRLSWTNDRYQPLWRQPAAGPGYGAGPLVWARDLTATEQAWGYVHTFDTTNAYLASAISADVAWSELRPTGPQMFDAKLPGYWLVQPEQSTLDLARDPLRPPLLPARKELKGGRWWMTTPYARLLADLGDRVEVLDSRTGRAGVRPDGTRIHPAQSRILRKWGEQLRDGLTTAGRMAPGGLRDTLTYAIKRTYKDATGGMQRDGMRVSRHDWAHTVIDLRAATLYRRILHVHKTQGVWPVAVKIDSVSYADCVPTPQTSPTQGFESLGESIGVRAGVGGLTYDGTVTSAEWMAARKRKARR